MRLHQCTNTCSASATETEYLDMPIFVSQ